MKQSDKYLYCLMSCT